VNVYARVFYQSVPPRWVQDMFTYSSEAIDTFESMYDVADQSPLMVAHDSLMNIVLPTLVSNLSVEKSLRLLNSRDPYAITIENKSRLMIYDVRIFEMKGTLRSIMSINRNVPTIPVKLPDQSGIYLIRIKTNEGSFVFKVVKEL
jgi:hypothetical protein